MESRKLWRNNGLVALLHNIDFLFRDKQPTCVSEHHNSTTNQIHAIDNMRNLEGLQLKWKIKNQYRQ